LDATFHHSLMSVCKIQFMRYFIPIIGLSFLLIFFAGCQKREENRSTTLDGAWELRQIRGNLTLNFEPGNGNVLKFNGSHYEVSSNGQITSSGTYEVVPDLTAETELGISITGGQYVNRIIFEDSTDSKIFYQLSGNKLTFGKGFFPLDWGSFTEYARK